jgi:predicted dehydrogenase
MQRFTVLKTAIIGISGYGAEHLRLLLHGQKKGLMQPCAAVVINPGEVVERVELLESFGCRIYGSVEEMWSNESGAIDLCMIPTSIGTHFPFARMALENGSHVFLEKPVCGTLQEAQTLAAVAIEHGREVCVGFQDLYGGDVRGIKRRILGGDIGRIIRVKGWGSWPRATSYYERNSWAGQLHVNGSWVLDSPVNNAMAHFLMILLYWSGLTEDAFGVPESLKADLFRAQNIPSFDTASLKVGLRDGPDVLYGVTHSAEENIQVFLLIEGEKGRIEWEHFNEIRITTDSGTEIIPCEDLGSLREGMIEQVCLWVTKRSGKVVGLEDALLHTKLVNALHDGFPIRDFPADRIQRRAIQDQTFRFVPGLLEDLRTAHESDQLLSELSPEIYGPAPKPFPLENYTAFKGAATPLSMATA